MKRLNILSPLLALGLLAACEVKVGNDDKTGGNATATAEGKAEDGSFSIDAPGFAMKVDLPESIAKRAAIDSDSGLLYPGSKLSGIHVEATDEAKEQNGVELRFTSTDAVEKLAAWYRDPARAGDFTISSAGDEGGALVISGTQKDDGDPFTLRLSPASGGGSEGRLTLRDRS